MSKIFFYSFSKTVISKIIELIALAVMQLCKYIFTHKTTGTPLCVRGGGGTSTPLCVQGAGEGAVGGGTQAICKYLFTHETTGTPLCVRAGRGTQAHPCVYRGWGRGQYIEYT